MNVLFCCGMGRSGGTRQYQIAAATVEHLGVGRGIGFGFGLGKGSFDQERGWLVCKKEMPEPWALKLCNKAVGIVRDPRDVVCSFMRWRGAQGRYADFEHALEETALAARWFEKWEPRCAYVSRYEDYNAAADAQQVAGLFGRTLDNACEIAARYSVEANRERMAKMDRWINPSIMLTKAHIGPQGGRSVWREALEPEQVAQVQERLGDWMEAHGYGVLDRVG